LPWQPSFSWRRRRITASFTVGDASQTFLDLGGRFIVAATVALALGLATDVYVVIGKIAHSGAIGLAAGSFLLAF
jgi:DNA-binding transcriptional regulator/RsmH inhibitor MraZ